MSVTTIGQWIDLPTSGGASDRLDADEPGGAGLFQIAASNATLGARENGLRTLWEDFGSSDVSTNLLIPGDADTFPWWGEDSDGIYARFCGFFRVRLFGETATPPRLHLAARALAPSGYETGLVLAVSSAADPRSILPGAVRSALTASTSLTSIAATLDLRPEMLSRESLSLRSSSSPPTEAGQHTVIAVWAGAWCTSNSGAAKGAVYGLSLLLREP